MAHFIINNLSVLSFYLSCLFKYRVYCNSSCIYLMVLSSCLYIYLYKRSIHHQIVLFFYCILSSCSSWKISSPHTIETWKFLIVWKNFVMHFFLFSLSYLFILILFIFYDLRPKFQNLSDPKKDLSLNCQRWHESDFFLYRNIWCIPPFLLSFSYLFIVSQVEKEKKTIIF